jgi:2-amino-4-hydroxy-6-hydroxymethyldihydropteridine diphosphokinase
MNPNETIRVYIGLGSNLDNPRRQVERALTELASLDGCKLVRFSRLYRSRAIGPGDQPDYVNGAALVETRLTPYALLEALQSIESAHKRIRTLHWGPRTLDLDMLLYGDQVIASEPLTVPHPHLAQRNFVLYPLADITPELVLPSGIALAKLLDAVAPDGLELLS